MDAKSQTKDTEWITPTRASLYHGDKLIGIITNITVEDMFQWSGDIELTSAASACQPMFDYFNDEKNQREPEEPDESPCPFDESLLDDWFIEDENGKREVSFPVVTPEGEVFWRD
jgi:hypothetical protein